MTNNAPPDLLTELYVAHYPGLVRLAAMLLDEPAACEDVVQEAYIRAAAAKGGYGIPTPRSRTYGGPSSTSAARAMRRRLVATRYLSRNLPESTVSDG
jgi:DNA-directed RNA polymerase specialized sigma24 family protein